MGLPLLVLAVVALAITVVNARESKDFERRALRIAGTIVRNRRDERSWLQHVSVRIPFGTSELVGRAPVGDPAQYEVGDEVVVLYDPEGRGRMRLDEERYDAASPALFWSAVFVAGLLPVLMGWWWVRRVRRIVAGSGPAFAMRVTVTDLRPRWWNIRRPWVTLYPLDSPSTDDARAVGVYPLMSGVTVPIGAAAPAEVKGQVRDGGVVVARCGDVPPPLILWPRRRLRS